MAQILFHQAGISPEIKAQILAVCPFQAIQQEADGTLSVNAGCRLCRICCKKFPEICKLEETAPQISVDKTQWNGIAVAAELSGDVIHPVSLELLGKARVLAEKVGHQVYAVLTGKDLAGHAETLRQYGADEVHVYDAPELEHFRIEPYTNVLEDFIRRVQPAVVLMGGTPGGRTLAPRIAARCRTGLTADCTVLDIKENTDLDQIRPAFGGNIMAHINTPNHRPQFATVRYKIFPLPEPLTAPSGKIITCSLPAEKLQSAIEILSVQTKQAESGIEDAEVIVAVGRGLKKQEDMRLIEQLASALDARIAGTRCLVEAGWLEHKQQIGLSGRTVAPKLILCCGISGSVQFAAGMKGAEKIIAINTDPEAAIFNIAHVGIVGDLYEIIPELLEKIGKKG